MAGGGYNATVWRMNGDRVVSVFTAEVTGAGVMLRGNAVQCTGLEGTEAYDAYVRTVAFEGQDLRVVRDGCAGYRARLRGLAVPPAYRS